MKLLIDTNVILDIVFDRKNCETAVTLFRLIEMGEHTVFITASSVTDLFYIVRKEIHDTKQTYKIMSSIFKLVNVLSVTAEDIHEAFGNEWKDFEDCVQYTVAKNNKITYLVTSNRKDFPDNALTVLSLADCIEILKKRNRYSVVAQHMWLKNNNRAFSS